MPFGLALQGRLDDRLPRGLVVLRLTPPSGGDFPGLADALRADALAPQLHCGSCDPELPCDRHIILTGQGGQDNPAAQSHLLWGATGGLPLFQVRSFRRPQLDL